MGRSSQVSLRSSVLEKQQRAAQKAKHRAYLRSPLGRRDSEALVRAGGVSVRPVAVDKALEKVARDFNNVIGLEVFVGGANDHHGDAPLAQLRLIQGLRQSQLEMRWAGENAAETTRR
jgi:hypothetical protein